MNPFRRIFDRIATAIIARATRRDPDFVVGGREDPYLLRWYLLGSKPDPRVGKRSRTILGLVRPYVHCFLRSDDDRAHHDHPAASISIALRGTAIEHTIAAGGIHHRRQLKAGQIRFRSAKFAHRIEIEPGTELWTLFIFGRNTRDWGFHCPERGWIPWWDFVAADDKGVIGPGCGDAPANDNAASEVAA